MAILLQYVAIFSAVFTVISIGLWIFLSYCTVKIGRKLNVSGAWMAYVPVANIFYFIKIAGKSYWWALLAFAPTIITPLAFIIGGFFATALSVSLSVMLAVFYVVLWLAVLGRLNMPKWYVVLMIIPVVNFFVLGYLAFSKVHSAEFGGGSVIVNQQLFDYVNQQLNDGVDKESIRKSLLDAGWTEDVINKII